MNASHTPPKSRSASSSRARPRRAAPPKPWPMRPTTRVARLRSSLRHHISACTIWAPSSGKAGIRLRISTSTLSVAIQLSHSHDGRRAHAAAADGDREEVVAARQQPRRVAMLISDHRERHERPRRGHAQLDPRAGHRAGAGDAAERPQLDAHHRHAVAARRPARGRARAGSPRRRTRARSRPSPGRRWCATPRALRGSRG